MKSDNQPLQIGITGGIGSGKSLVCHIFHTLGIAVYDADSRAKWLMNHHEALRRDIQVAFGTKAYSAAGQLDKQYLAAQVFNDGEKVQSLNRIVHPKVAEDYTTWVQAHNLSPYLIKEAALLFESGSYQLLDKVITVFAPLEIRLQRILKRDPQRTTTEINAIIKKQMSEEDKIQRADFVIYNDESRLLIPQILALHQQFLGVINV